MGIYDNSDGPDFLYCFPQKIHQRNVVTQLDIIARMIIFYNADISCRRHRDEIHGILFS